jgi:predicted DNA-binding transcriptional regulator AlpA
VNDDGKYLSENELSALLRVSKRTIQRWRASGDGPPFVRVGAKSIRYELSSCKTWADQRTFIHHAQELTARKS